MSLKTFLKRYNRWIILFLIFALHLFLRFYQLETRLFFGPDQLESSWAAKGIIVDHVFPLLGPANKLGSGIYIGPLYYYLISIFYFFTGLDPIAAGLFAGATSIFAFFVLFLVTKKLFSFDIALLAVFINTVSFSGVEFDRMQWEINFIPAISLLVLYSLYKVLSNEPKYFLLLAFALGSAFHIHFTISVFLPIIIILSLPFVPRNKTNLKYFLISLPLFLIWLVPIGIANLNIKNSLMSNTSGYIGASFHGFHLTRFFQLFSAAFIQIESFLTFPVLRLLTYLILPLFFISYCFRKLSRSKVIFCYLALLWFIVPWIVFTTYSGQITDYYFSVNRFIGLIMISYLLMKVITLKKTYIGSFIIIFLLYYTLFNLDRFMSYRRVGLQNYKAIVRNNIKISKKIEYEFGNPYSYLYWLYTEKK